MRTPATVVEGPGHDGSKAGQEREGGGGGATGWEMVKQRSLGSEPQTGVGRE